LLLDAYIRVSQVRGRKGESFISPDVQRSEIETWAKLRNVTIGAWHTDLDESGGVLSRPGLDLLLERIRAGETGGIVVAHLDRLSRADVAGALKLIEEIHAQGGQVAVVDLGLDPTTPLGEFGMTIMLALARMQRRQIAGNWDIARERAVARGIHPCPTVPFGYRRREDRRLEPDPRTASWVRALYERRASGEAWSSLGRWLEEQGARTAGWGRNTWSLRAMRDIIRSDVYLGVASHGDFRNVRAHEPIVDRLLWQRAQRRGTVPTALSDEPALLAGVLRCAGCRYVMRVARRRLADGRMVLDYACRAGAGGERTHRCEEPARVGGKRDDIEGLVIKTFLDGLPGREARAKEERPRLTELECARDEARGSFEEWRDDVRAQRLGMVDYMAGLERRKHLLDEADAKLAAERNAVPWLPIAAPSIQESWSSLSVLEQRELVQAGLECVFVARGSDDLRLRVRVVWRGESVDLPARGRRDFRPRPIPIDHLKTSSPVATGKDP